jgi:hypothetical protein
MKKQALVWGIALLVVGLVLTRVVQAGGIDVKTTLVGSAAFPDAKGTARFRNPGRPKPRTLDVTVDTSLPAGAVVKVFLVGSFTGSITLDAAGNGELHESSQFLLGGKTVEVRLLDGTLVMSGTF